MRILVLLATLLVPSAALAQARAGKPSHGFYVELDAGATSFIGETERYAAVGPTLGVRVGRDLTRWFSLGGVASSTTHEATVPPPPEDEYFQLYRVGAELRFTARLGRVSLFAEGGPSVSYLSTNILERVEVTSPDERWSLVWTGGAGLAWHTRNRHFSVGLAGEWAMFTSYDGSMSVGGRLYLRYTK